ncbi:MAG: hypothetical protein DGJ47_000167 [Rickettsiaceae bacterium]
MRKLIKICLIAFTLIAGIYIYNTQNKEDNSLPLIAIANYGPHSSLEETIEGIKEGLNNLGYVEGKTIRYRVSDVNFETSLISQMITTLLTRKPNVLVSISTPVSQHAKKQVLDVPLVFVNVTDPNESGLMGKMNMTGVSDKQNLELLLKFSAKLIPNAKRVGVMYSTGEANDAALIKMLEKATSNNGLELMKVPLEHSRDAATRINIFKNNVDFIYTGSSAAVQSALPSIVRAAESMNIAVINFDHDDVINDNVLASYGVSHGKIGVNAAKIIDQILKGTKIENIPVSYPQASEHKGYISKKRAEKINLTIPTDIKNLTIIE